MTTDMRYTVNIDAQQADAELMKLRSEVVTLAGQEQAMAKATDAATAALVKHGDAAAKAAPKVETLRERANKLPDILGKQAAAISLVSSSLEGMGGNVGKAVAGAGQMAAAYGAGGPFALALVGGIAIIDKLTQYWKSLNDEEDRNIKLKFGVIDAAKSRTEALKAEVAELEKKARPEQARANERQGIADEIRRSEIERDQLRRRAEIRGTTAEQAQMMRAEAQQLDEQVKLLAQKLTLMAEIRNQGGTPTTTTAAEPETYVDTDAGMAAIDLNARRAAKRKKAWAAADEAVSEETRRREESDAEHQLQIWEDQADAKAAIDQRKKDDEKRVLDEMAAAHDAYYGRLASYAQQSAGIIAGTSQQLIADLISGQEYALERFGISVMAQAGQALVGNGIQLLGEAVVSAGKGLFPIAAGQAALGGALITTGVGLGGVAGGLSGLMGAESGGAARGASPRTSTGATSVQGGPTQITYIFTPSRDEGAAAVAIAGRTADNRQLNKTRTR